MKKTALFVTLVTTCHLLACNSGNKSDTDSAKADSLAIAHGKQIFEQNCSSCHGFKQNNIGPLLGGITAEQKPAWLSKFISDPKKMLAEGDPHTTELFQKYRVLMPSFPQITAPDMQDLLAYMGTHEKPKPQISKTGTPALQDAITDSIRSSDLVVDLQFLAQFPASGKPGQLPSTRITKFDFEPGSKKNFVVDLRGKMYSFINNQPQLYFDLAGRMPKFIMEPGLATGFGSFAFHPDFARNGYLYTTHTEPAGSGVPDFNYPDSIKVSMQWVITEWKTEHPEAPVFSGRGRELLRINMPTQMHGVQEITFNPLAKPGEKDYGQLYIGIGDGGAVDEGHYFITHNKSSLLGTIIRINPRGNNSVNGRYGIPADNPFANVHDNQTRREIYAMGFRNPHRIDWTSSGLMLVSNIGGANIESVNLVKPAMDFGWPEREGAFLIEPDLDWHKIYPLPADDSSHHYTYPVIAYDHDGQSAAISGGYAYRGSKIKMLEGKYIFGDIPSGRLFYSNMKDLHPGKLAPIYEWHITASGQATTLKELCKNDRVDLHFGQDANGELYILTKADGKIYALAAAQ